MNLFRITDESLIRNVSNNIESAGAPNYIAVLTINTDSPSNNVFDAEKSTNSLKDIIS